MSNIGQFKRHWGVYPRNPNEEEKRRKQQKGRTSLFAVAAGQRLGLTAYTSDPYRPSCIGDIFKRERRIQAAIFFSFPCCMYFRAVCEPSALLIMIGMLLLLYVLCTLWTAVLCFF
jgi:hypothetical protein